MRIIGFMIMRVINLLIWLQRSMICVAELIWVYIIFLMIHLITIWVSCDVTAPVFLHITFFYVKLIY